MTTFDEIRPGCWKQKERLEDMAANHMDASICFPNTLPRFCGQTFMEREDKELALLCVQAYNDWIIDEWCAGDGYGKLIPLTIVPLWDVQLAPRRSAAAPPRAPTRWPSRRTPTPWACPSIHSEQWDPFFAACEETDTVVCMHIGSSSKMPQTTPDAPFIVSSTLTFQNAMGSLIDYVFSGTLARFPKLVIAYSRGPGRLDALRDGAHGQALARARRQQLRLQPARRRRPPTSTAGSTAASSTTRPASPTATASAWTSSPSRCDYPHADSTFPHTEKVATEICVNAGLNDDEIYKLMRGNAIKGFGLQRFGITE